MAVEGAGDVRCGEDNEFVSQLTGLFEQARQGDGSVVLVSGHAGYGKSAVLATCAEQVESNGGLVLRATASVAEGALRLGVVGQLLQSCPAGRAGIQQLIRLLDEGVHKAPDTHSALGMHGDPSWAEAVRGMWSALLHLSSAGPVLMVVDDVGYADVASLDCLLYFARRVASTRILLVLSELEHPRSDRCVVHRELLKLPQFQDIRLTPLTTPAIGQILARYMREDVARRGTRDCQEATGGNPRLVLSLLKDHLAAAEPSATRLVAGPAFESAVVSIVHSYGPAAIGVARGLAMLGEWSSSTLLSQLIDIDTASVAQTLGVLGEAGLLAGESFRHPAAAAAVWQDMSPADRSDLHMRTAELLHSEGVPATTVASHLLAAPSARQPWAVAVLEEAADEALANDRLQLASDSLKLALRVCTVDDRRAVITMKLALARWRADPMLAARYYPALVDALRRGLLRGRHAAALVRSLLWYGRFDDAVETLERLAMDSHDAETAAELRLTHVRLRHTYPALSVHTRLVDNDVPEHSQATTVLKIHANMLLAAVLRQEAPDDVRRRTEQILTITTMNDASLDTLQAALLTLMYADHTDSAALWCDRQLADANTRQAPSWRAVFAAIRAEIDLRQGDLPSAEYHAKTALGLIKLRGWGAAVGAPVSVLIRAFTATGRFEEAAEQLDQDLLEASFQTRYGLHYLAARGHYYLATNQSGAALADFLACGDLMGSWGIDVASLVPWRTDAAEVYLRMGELDKARELASEQLTRNVVDGSRAHGFALVVLAATESDLDVRRCLCNDAVALFEACGDRYGLARALVASGAAHLAVDDKDSARTDAVRARDLAREIGAEPIIESLTAAGLDAVLPAEQQDSPPARADRIGELSDAERKVARLAALGRTNRDIAAELFITVSTVEQHLTRAYRKLRVTRRMDLPSELHLGAIGSE